MTISWFEHEAFEAPLNPFASVTRETLNDIAEVVARLARREPDIERVVSYIRAEQLGSGENFVDAVITSSSAFVPDLRWDYQCVRAQLNGAGTWSAVPNSPTLAARNIAEYLNNPTKAAYGVLLDDPPVKFKVQAIPVGQPVTLRRTTVSGGGVAYWFEACNALKPECQGPVP